MYNQFITELTGKLEEDKVAEVRFLRALNYYYFLDLYRKAPFKDTFDDKLPTEKSGKDLYEWLDNELTTIEPLMAEVGAYNNSENFGRADRGAAYALHARLALNSAVYTNGQVKDYQKAIDYCDKIIDSNNMIFAVKQRMATAVTSSCSWAIMTKPRSNEGNHLPYPSGWC